MHSGLCLLALPLQLLLSEKLPCLAVYRLTGTGYFELTLIAFLS